MPEAKRTAKQKAAYYRQWVRKNRTRVRKYKAEWASQNREKMREANRRYRQKHRSKLSRKNKQHYQTNPEYYRTYRKQWSKTEYGRISFQRAGACRRAEREGAKGSFSTDDVLWLVSRQKQKCAICKKLFPPPGTRYRFDIDHIVPLSKGGSNNLKNLQLLHRSCNLKKDRSL